MEKRELLHELLFGGTSIRRVIDEKTISKAELADMMYKFGDDLKLQMFFSRNTVLSDELSIYIQALKREFGNEYTKAEREKKPTLSTDDIMYEKIVDYTYGKATISSLELKNAFDLSYSRAAKYMLLLEQNGIVKKNSGRQPHEVLAHLAP